VNGVRAVGPVCQWAGDVLEQEAVLLPDVLTVTDADDLQVAALLNRRREEVIELEMVVGSANSCQTSDGSSVIQAVLLGSADDVQRSEYGSAEDAGDPVLFNEEIDGDHFSSFGNRRA
jgi:hypothetical protein